MGSDAAHAIAPRGECLFRALFPYTAFRSSLFDTLLFALLLSRRV